MAKHSRINASTGRKLAAVSVAGLSATAIVASAGNASAVEVQIPNTPYTANIPDDAVATVTNTVNQAASVAGQNIVPAANAETVAPAATAAATSVAPIQDVGSRIAAAANSKVGSPYAWGATGPSAFDCSGLVKWAYAQVGINVPRTSGSQLAGGTQVSEANLQPGDIIGYYGGGHVAVYLGNGQVVHAPDQGQTVKVVPLNSMQFYSATRYF